jgi:hypothetical protein
MKFVSAGHVPLLEDEFRDNKITCVLNSYFKSLHRVGNVCWGAILCIMIISKRGSTIRHEID